MHSTKTEILAHLKRNDGSTVDGIASSLNLAPMTVRQHLMALERDGMVRAEEVRRFVGRPLDVGAMASVVSPDLYRNRH